MARGIHLSDKILSENCKIQDYELGIDWYLFDDTHSISQDSPTVESAFLVTINCLDKTSSTGQWGGRKPHGKANV